MKQAFEVILSETIELEEKLAIRIAEISELLEPALEERDYESLQKAMKEASSLRRRIAVSIRAGQAEIEHDDSTGIMDARRARQAKRAFKTSRDTLRLWNRFGPLLNSQIYPEKSDFYEEAPFIPIENASVFDHVTNLMEAFLHRAANPGASTRSEDAVELGCHRDIPLPMRKFSHLIGSAHRACLALRKDGPLRFLDVGSGGGTKLLAATTCFEVCHGLEYDKNAVSHGQKLLELLAPDSCKLISGDALQFEGYGDYDVIYYYRPLMETDKMIELEKRIVEFAKSGTIIIAVNVMAGGMVTSDPTTLGVFKLAEDIFMTDTTQEEGERLLDRAELIGKSVSGFNRRPLPPIGYWEPLRKVSARNGFII